MKIKLGLGKMSMSDVCRYTGGAQTGEDVTFEYICTDSREADGETLFIATKGERVDGHSYISSAQRLGCRCFLCERIPEGVSPDSCFCTVESSMDAFGALARGYREAYPLDCVAITGSVGKTTTKELTARVLSEGFELFCTEGNFNSVIGMPMSMMSVREGIRTAVFEMGMSGFGEISQMSRTARPRIAMITNIGSSHLEYLGTRENIAKAKFEIAEGLREDGILLLNGDEPLLREQALSHPDKRCMFLSLEGNGDITAENIRLSGEGSLFDVRHAGGVLTDMFVPAIGRHIVFDALFSVCVGLIFGLGEEQIRRGLAGYIPGGYRQKIIMWDGKSIIADCYNASPESVRSALDVLIALDGRRKIAVLGDMKELGKAEAEMHREIGERAARCGIDILVCVGPLALNIAQAAESGMARERIYACGTNPEAAEILKGLLRDGDVILFKGSRSMKLEQIIEELTDTGSVK